LGKTVVFVTHDVDEAVLLGDQIAVMRPGGVLAQLAPTAELLTRPADAFVARFLGSDRAQKLLSLRPASGVPSVGMPQEGLNGWALETDEESRPTHWRAMSTTAGPSRVAIEAVGPHGSVRDLLDSALASPARTAVRVDAQRALEGIVPWFNLEQHLEVAEHDVSAEMRSRAPTGEAVEV
jgi:osmoprotectant transport system ATP-binding protein